MKVQLKRKKVAKTTAAGAVGNIFMPDLTIKQKQSLGIWAGGISLDKKLAKRLEEVTSPENLGNYFVPVDYSAPTRCIDGRLLADWTKLKKLQSRGLGPQSPGGTPATAIIHRIIMMGEVGGPSISFETDLKEVIAAFSRNNIYFGGHIDEHNEKHPENTGCGAIDKLPEILAQMVSPKAFREIKALCQVLLPTIYDDRIANELIGRLVLLQADSEIYLQYDKRTKRYKYKHLVMETMRKSATKKNIPVEKLVGPHNEKGLIINMVKGTTFDRDKFGHDNANEIQLFNYDAWRTQQTAKVLYPDTNKKNRRHQQEYVLARTMYAVATAMVLTDGTLNLYVRS
jgi:hypothetical protein